MGSEAIGQQVNAAHASIPIVNAPQANIMVHAPGPQMAANNMLWAQFEWIKEYIGVLINKTHLDK